jgi:hypothetical protein
MFRALRAHHQEAVAAVQAIWYNILLHIWYMVSYHV